MTNKMITIVFTLLRTNVLATIFQYYELKRLVRLECSATIAINYSYDSTGNILMFNNYTRLPLFQAK